MFTMTRRITSFIRIRALGRPTRHIPGFGALLAIAALGGCLDDATRKQMSDANSILAPVFKQTPTPKEAAAWASDPYDADKRARGTMLLANAPFGGADAYLDMYRQHLKDSSASVQAAAARALGMHGTPEDVPRLAPLMSSRESMVRLEATRSMQRLYNPAAVTPLVVRLSDDKEPEAEIRAEAASALGQYAEPKVLQALIAALADPSLLVDMNAHESLRTLTGKDDLPSERAAWMQWSNGNKQTFAGQRPYVYPVFWREKHWVDYLPFMPAIPNEIAASPVGFPDLEGRSDRTAAAAGDADRSNPR